jgi:type I restriction enzyme S subunit
MSEWKETTLGEAVLKANTGADAIQKAPIVNYDSGIRCLRIQNISNSHDFNEWGFCEISQDNYRRFYLKKGDILIARTGNTIGVNIYIEQDLKAVFNNGLIRLNINKEKFIPKYIYYLFQTYNFKGHINSIAYGTSTQPNMQIESLLRFNFNYPPVNVQEKIVNLFSTLDKKIDNLRRQNETLETIAQTLFKHWFIDFEFPNDEGKPYKSSGGAMVASELGDIPEGWRVGKLGDITRVINGRAYKQTEFREEGTPIVRIQNLTGEGKTVYSDLSLDKDKYIESGDLIYAWSATFGPYIWRGAKSIYHYHIWKLNCYYEWFKYYLFIHLKRVSETVKNQGTGSIFTHITKDLMENQELLVPDDKTMLKWDSCITPLFDKIMSNYQQIQTLTKTRDTLLPKLMNGQIRVKD